MARQIEPEAFFDSLSIAHKLDNFLDGFELEEIHLFSYFAAILYHYSGKPVDDWKYGFIVSSNGYPHSKILHDAIERHISSGLFEERVTYHIITSRGADEFNKFLELKLLKGREKYLDAACATSILVPYKETKRALLEDPSIRRATELANDDWLAFSNDKLKEITQALGAPVDELIIPAVSWIRFLLATDQTSD
ncbi:hypothetical protein KC622_00235 [Candidatus Dojkabacteria bacterium]|uniref:Uncharacterized protein n=1 Tax=Candidatus Dojkabacteria bacterium TaxID=2099670 RepID=A0A955I1C3_9BACT|nr:hypothetical protein [Candidatus Dojkabacteria bacterium]MCA9734297.1 hypothetical protein [candidate division KSB1 bacterium]